MQCGAALPGGIREHRTGRRGNEGISSNNQRAPSYRPQNMTTPCAILPNSLRQTYIDSNSPSINIPCSRTSSLGRTMQQNSWPRHQGTSKKKCTFLLPHQDCFYMVQLGMDDLTYQTYMCKGTLLK